MNQNQPKVPAIMVDLDGVLWKEDRRIDAAEVGLRNLTANLEDIVPTCLDQGGRLPFVFVTNSGSCPQSIKSDKIIKCFPGTRVSPSDIILNQTPLIQELEKFKDDILLVSGGLIKSEKLHEGILLLGISKFITFEEYAKIYPQLWYNPVCSEDERLSLLQVLSQRLGVKVTSEQFIKVGAIIFLGDTDRFELVSQITCDVLSTENGVPSLVPTNIPPTSHIPVYTVFPDMFYPSKQGLLRLGFGSFFQAIENFYRLYFNTDLKVNKYGKPSPYTAQYSKNVVDNIAKQNQCTIQNYYMIGDNPTTDIRMANLMGWQSVLVETGVYQSGSEIEDELNKPTYIVRDFGEAIRIIFEKEGLKFHNE